MDKFDEMVNDLFYKSTLVGFKLSLTDVRFLGVAVAYMLRTEVAKARADCVRRLEARMPETTVSGRLTLKWAIEEIRAAAEKEI